MRFNFFILLLLIKIAEKAYSVEDKTAKEVYDSMIKSFTFRVSSDFLSQTPLLYSHYVNYVVRPLEYLTPGEDPLNARDGLVSFVVVGSHGIYRKKLNKRWINYTEESSDNERNMTPLREYNNKKDDKAQSWITAAQMYGNESILTIAQKNMTVETIDLRQSSRDLPTIINSFDASYKYGNEPGDEIRSIGRIPYSDEILIQPNRFEIIKASRRGGNETRVRAPLDSVRFIECPVPTGDTLNDPHSPNRTKKDTI